MRRLIALLMMITLLYTIIPIDIVYADHDVVNIEESVTSSLDKIDFGSFDEFMTKYLGDKDIAINSMRQYVESIISGEFDMSFSSVIHVIGEYLLRSLLGFLPLVVVLVALAILYSIVDSMSSRFSSRSICEIVYFVTYVEMIVAVMAVLVTLVSDVVRVTRGVHEFMSIIFPVELTLMTALGGVVTVGSLKPLMASLAFIVSGIVLKIIMPIFIATIVFSIVGNLTSSIRLDKITCATKSIGEFLLGGIFSIFTSIMLLQGVTGSTIDSVSIKSAKFAISSYVPILGGYLSDGFDVAMASIVLIKNAIGYVGIIVILMLVLAPVLKVALFALVLKVASGVIEPIADSRMSELLYSVSNNLGLLIAIILGVAFVFLVMSMFVILTLNVVV